MELSAERLVEEYTERVLKSLQDLLPHVRSGLKEYAKYLKHSPTALETAILDHLLDLCQDYAYVIVDSAPTGQMLRLFETAHMVKGWFDFLTRLAREREKVQAFMGKKDSLLSLIEERKSKVERLLDILREKSLVFAVANEEPLSMEEAQEIKRSLRDMKVHIVLNRWRSMEGDFIKVQEAERPYGIEALEGLRTEGIVGIIKSE